MRAWKRTPPVALGLLVFVLTASALASLNIVGAGSGYSKAQSLPAGNAPTATVSNRNVAVSWTASSGGAPVAGYLVKRYDTSSNLQTIGSACTGTIAATSCTENAVPAGSWKYSVTPVQGNNWQGTESAQSATATVAAPTLSLNQSTVNALPSTLTGTISNFIAAETVTYRLDNPSTGTVLSGSITPSPVPSTGTATVSVTLPAGTTNATHTIYAVGSSGDQPGASVTVNRPQIGTSAIAKSAGGLSGEIKQGGIYFVYANATGSGDPPAGFSTMTADVSSITTGQTAVALVHGSFSVNGATYNYRSAQLTANSSLTAGSKSYTLTLTDTAGSTTQSSFSVTVDNTTPTAHDIATTNFGSTVGLAQATDTITYTFSEAMDPNSILSGWDGTSTNVVVHLQHGIVIVGGNDLIQIFNAADSTQLPLGQIDLGRTDYCTGLLGGVCRFGATGTAATMVMSGSTVTVTLGTQSGNSPSTAGGTGTMVLTPSTTPTDAAGNSLSSATATESETPADKEF